MLDPCLEALETAEQRASEPLVRSSSLQDLGHCPCLSPIHGALWLSRSLGSLSFTSPPIKGHTP